MSVAVLEQAVERAVELRGTVMLAVRGNERQWCAVCAAVDGSLELRLGKPEGGPWRRARRSADAWLRDQGFVPVLDAWSKPISRATPARSCARILDTGLHEALAAPASADLVEVLVHPGVFGSDAPPSPDAPHAEHIRFAFDALAHEGRGKVDIQGGRPAETWAWVFVIDGELVVSPETSARDDEWRVPLAPPEVAVAADRLSALLHGDLGRDERAPLFISWIDAELSART